MTETIHYRKALLADTKKLSILYKQVYIQTYGREGVSDEFANFITNQFAVERLTEIITNEPDNIIVAEYKGNLVGVAEIVWDRQAPMGDIKGPELSKLYILEWFSGRGIGWQLLQAAEQVALAKGHALMWLWVLDTNQRAVDFYQRQQYKIIGNAPFRMEVNSYDNHVMVKDLSAHPTVLPIEINEP